MKTSSLIKKYYNKQSKRLLSVLKKNEEDYYEEDYHSIRVAIKKIKSLLSLLKKLYPSFRQKKYFKPFSKVFEQAGEIRDRAVLYHLFEKYPKIPSNEKFREELIRHIQKEKKEFFRMLKKQLIKDLRKTGSRIEGFLKKVRHAKATSYADKRSKAIRKRLQSNVLTPKRMHDIRKRVKDLYYIQKMLESKNQKVVDTNKFQDLLGLWHDGRMLALAMGVFENSGIISGKDKLAFDALQTKVTTKNDRQFRSFIRRKSALVKLISG